MQLCLASVVDELFNEVSQQPATPFWVAFFISSPIYAGYGSGKFYSSIFQE